MHVPWNNILESIRIQRILTFVFKSCFILHSYLRFLTECLSNTMTEARRNAAAVHYRVERYLSLHPPFSMSTLFAFFVIYCSISFSLLHRFLYPLFLCVSLTHSSFSPPTLSLTERCEASAVGRIPDCYITAPSASSNHCWASLASAALHI